MGVTKNFFYNSSITVSTYLVSFLVFPYVSRVLGVSNVGTIGFVDNVINYFVMFSVLGIQTVGIREIATQNNRGDTTKVFSGLLSFLIVTISVCLLIYFLCVFLLRDFQPYRKLLLIGVCKLMFTPLMIEWLYAGKQDFKYISIRTIVIKVLYLVSIFVFVRNSDDTDIYFMLTSLSVFANFCVNSLAARKYIDIRNFKFTPLVYAGPIMKMGVFAIITSLYSGFNVICLGKVSTMFQVGLYCTAIKLYDIIMNLFRSYTSVVMPQMSLLVSNKKNRDIDILVNKSFSAFFSFSIPLSVMTILLSPFIVRVIAGDDYIEASTPMRIIMPILVVAGINQVIGVQILMPLKKDNILLITASLASFVGILSNLILDTKYGAVGAAITILLAETIGCIGGIYYTQSRHLISFPIKLFMKYVLSSIPYVILYFLLKMFNVETTFANILIIIFFLGYYVVQQIYICDNPLIIMLVNRIRRGRDSEK